MINCALHLSLTTFLLLCGLRVVGRNQRKSLCECERFAQLKIEMFCAYGVRPLGKQWGVERANVKIAIKIDNVGTLFRTNEWVQSKRYKARVQLVKIGEMRIVSSSMRYLWFCVLRHHHREFLSVFFVRHSIYSASVSISPHLCWKFSSCMNFKTNKMEGTHADATRKMERTHTDARKYSMSRQDDIVRLSVN